MNIIFRLCTIVCVLLIPVYGFADGDKFEIKGRVLDAKTSEPLIGAAVIILEKSTGGVTDINGEFSVKGLDKAKYKIKVQYVGYKTKIFELYLKKKVHTIDIKLSEDSQALSSALVVAERMKRSEAAVLSSTKYSALVENGVSAQLIKKTQDKNASEVIKRIPGITINNNKFVMVRGLSQRYNNVWVNGAAIPSSEADTRAFSFDIIPSSQLDNIIVVKSPAPQYPADFSGGFILVNTKDIPEKNSFSIGVSTSYNDMTHGHNFLYNEGSKTDFLGVDYSKRPLKSAFKMHLNNDDNKEVDRFTNGAFNNDWLIKNHKPLADMGLSLAINRSYKTKNDGRIGTLIALNYSNNHRSYTNMSNIRYGIYNSVSDISEYENKYTDNQYSKNSRLGFMLNMTYKPSNSETYSLKNMINQLGQNRYTQREGFQNYSQLYKQEQYEYFYNSRLTYSGQISYKKMGDSDEYDWNIGYSYANNIRPDRRRINLDENDNPGDVNYHKMQINQNEIRREFNDLHEHIASAAFNYKREFEYNDVNIKLNTGIYSEYRTRDYKSRQFFYRWNINNMPKHFEYMDVVKDVLVENNFGHDKLYIYEDINNTNSYSGDNLLGAGYIGFNFTMGRWDVYAGARYEYNIMKLNRYTHFKTEEQMVHEFLTSDVYPSINTTYRINKENQLRFAYGMSVNRQEFREISPSIYYDFDLFSDVKGNIDLKPAKIHNIDFRYEYYPNSKEIISLALFYKYFKNPIEWSYLNSGGSYTYMFENALSARNFGLELDIRKNLEFMGLKDFSIVFNGAIINSKLYFPESSNEVDRPMQGQSPYIVNAGIFWQNDKLGVNASLMYNRIGKRIVGVGRYDKSVASSINNDLPDSYELPRNLLDLSISKKLFENWELSMSVKNILGEKMIFKQFPRFKNSEGVTQERSQITKEYNPGRSISIGIKYNF